ncbi:hypothetical protein ACFLQL_00095 [Verrucomicrobiota bacterium]
MKKIASSISPDTELLTIKCNLCGCEFLYIVPENKQALICCKGCPHKIQIKDLEDAIENKST